MPGRHFLVFLSLIVSSLSVAAEGEPASEFLDNGVTAHRGNSGEWPENTLPAFASALELGVDWIELDVFRTLDRQLVVIHDAATQRVGEQSLVVAESTFEQLQQVDVASEFRRSRGLTAEACPPQRIPLLEDVLRLVMRQERTRASLQPKMDCVADALGLVKQLGAERWVGFNDGTLAYMVQVKQHAPTIPVFWDRGADTSVEDDIQVARQHGFESLVLHHSGVTAEKVQQIRAAGLEAGAWTVNDRDRMTQLLDMGVQRLYTDNPRQLLALQTGRRFREVMCEGRYPKHLQGICADERSIYWSFTTQLVKTDLEGKVLAKVPVADHHGDLCHHDGKLYVAVNLGKFNDPQGNADCWIYVYRAGDLSFVSKHEAQEVRYGAGGIGYCDGHFFVVGGLPEGVEENYVYEYDGDLTFVRKHVIPSGHTHLGIQTATFAHDRWWFGCYGTPQVLLVTDRDFTMQGRYIFSCSLGIEGLPDGRLLAASGLCEKDKGCCGSARPAVPDADAGLRYAIPTEPGEGNDAN